MRLVSVVRLVVGPKVQRTSHSERMAAPTADGRFGGRKATTRTVRLQHSFIKTQPFAASRAERQRVKGTDRGAVAARIPRLFRHRTVHRAHGVESTQR